MTLKDSSLKSYLSKAEGIVCISQVAAERDTKAGLSVTATVTNATGKIL